MTTMNPEEKNFLSDDQLEAAAGGSVTVGGCRFSGTVGKYDGEVGAYYYVVDKSSYKEWWYGQMLDSYDDRGLFGTRRVHRIITELHNGNPELIYGHPFYADDVTLYTTMEQL